jgi:hypothetical protein
MKQWEHALILGAVALAFFAGMYVGSYGDTEVMRVHDSETELKLPALTIDQTTADFDDFFENNDEHIPIRLFVRNQTALLAEGRYAFVISINHSKLNNQLLNTIEDVFRNPKDRKDFLDMMRKEPQKQPVIAVVSYLERGRFKDGLDHEPTGLPDEIIYTANIYADVKLEPGAAGIIELKAPIPSNLRSFSYAVTGGYFNEQPPSAAHD